MIPAPAPRWWRGVVAPAIVCGLLQLGAGIVLARAGSAAAVPYLLLAALGIAALVAVAREPRLVVVVGATTIGGLLLLPDGPPVGLLALLAALVNAAARGARWWAIGTAAAGLLLPVLQLVLTENPLFAVRAIGECLLLGLAVVAGESVRIRRRRHEDERAAAAARAQMAADQERVRIARELHDVLAHSLSAISVQAGVGLHLAASRPEAATEALRSIRAASTVALDEVRGVIGLLRGDQAAPRAPAPGLDRAARLVDDAAALGLSASLDDRLHPRPGAAAELALFRIVQESLTNAGRHASGRTVRILLEREDGRAVARVRDSGGAGVDLPLPESGRGLIGMRERAELLGGTLTFVSHPDGLEVVASIPVEA